MILIPGGIPIYILRMFPNNLVDKGDRGKKLSVIKTFFCSNFLKNARRIGAAAGSGLQFYPQVPTPRRR